MTLDLLIRAPRVITSEGEVERSIGVHQGRIESVGPLDALLDAAAEVRLDPDEVLLPGLVDTHVHINEPGRTEWEGFASATRAAAAGGVTTLIDMPLNSIPPTCDVESLDIKRKTADGQCFVDVGFWGGAVPGNLAHLRPLHQAGVFGFKCFLLDSGVDEFPQLDREQLEEALRELATLDALLIVHAEDAHAIDRAPPPNGASYQGFLESRPRAAENLAIAQVIELARRTGARVHIVHLSSSDALPMISAARQDGVRLTVETCPHYLTFAAEEIPDGATQYKCCPPIREAANREMLWVGLRDGLIDFVVSDHSPCTAALKRLDTGDFGVAWGGIASLQLGLSAIWTQARRRQHSLVDVATWMAQRPADVVGMQRKGQIALGFDADFAVFAPDEAFVVDPSRLHHKNAVTPYAALPLLGRVRSTWLRGNKIADSGEIVGDPSGALLNRGGA
jgi:allantoinase